MASRLTEDEKSLLAKLLAEQDDDEGNDADEGDPEHDDASDEVHEVTYKGKRYRRVPDDEDEPQPVRKTSTKPKTKTPAGDGADQQSPAPRKRRFVT